MVDTIKQQLYDALADVLTGLGALSFTVYGSDDGSATDGPPPVTLSEADCPVAYLRLGDQFSLGVLDQRQVVQVRLLDSERRGYYRINAGLAVCARVFAPNRSVTYTNSDTSETWWAPEPAGWSGETEDPDRPGLVLRWGEWMFATVVGAAMVAAG